MGLTRAVCNHSGLGYSGFTDTLSILQFEDDAATTILGNGWRTPNVHEWQELYYHTNHTWTSCNGVFGCMFTANNGNCLFLPAAGYRSVGEVIKAGTAGCYLENRMDVGEADYAGDFRCGDHYGWGHHSRYLGYSVRAVRSAQ